MGRGMIVYEIDGEKLRDQVAEKGFSLVKASQEMGFNPYYISGCARHGKISSFGMKALTSLTGITLEDIKPEWEKIKLDPNEPLNISVEELLEQKKDPIDYVRLNKEIFGAVYGAIKKASIDGWLG